MEENRVLFELQNVTLITPNGLILSENISLTLSSGEILIIDGENGTGKTSLLKSILDINPLKKGAIKKNISPSEISYLPQLGNSGVFLPLTLKDVVNLDQDYSEKDILQLQLLTSSSLLRSWNTASGGEKQKALLTRTLLKNSRLIVLDEPFNHLDKDSKFTAAQIIECKRAQGTAVLIVSHEGHANFPNAKILRLESTQQQGAQNA